MPVGRPFQPGEDPRRNTGGRPRGLATRVRAAVVDGDKLVLFYLRVFRGESEVNGGSPVSLRDRLAAAEWLASRGWGKPRMEMLEEAEQEPTKEMVIEAIAAEIRQMPERERGIMLAWLEKRKRDILDAEVAEGRAIMTAQLPRR
jgi:hypothetical protein